MEPTTLLYALVGGLGLLGAEAYYSSSTIHVETSVAPIYENNGYSHQVVEAIFTGELENIANTVSVTGHVEFVTSDRKPVGSALAEAVGLSSSFDAAKVAIGIDHSMVLASVVVDTKDGKSTPRIVVAGHTNATAHFKLSLPLTEDTLLDAALVEAAFRTMNEINPYLTALYAFESAETNGGHPVAADRLVEIYFENAPASVYSAERALFENLRGLSALIDKDISEAEAWFQKAGKSDPELAPAQLNLAFVALYRGYNERAIELLKPIAEGSFWSVPEDDRVVYAAYVGLGLALAGLGNFDESDANFAEATHIRPDGVSVYYYWARALMKQNRTAEAKPLIETLQRNKTQIVNLPELASLYFWLPEEPNGSLERRTKNLPVFVVSTHETEFAD